ncbi:MAG: diaminopimelate epimerase [Desulfovibrionaceae bacterium]
MTHNTMEFHKMHGCGNDFVLIDNRRYGIAEAVMADWARAVCRRAFSVGADGLIFLDAPGDRPGVDYVWHFYNADGSRAEMCGNASRCATRLAVELGLAGPEHVIGTDAGPIKARLLPGGDAAKVQLTPPLDLATNLTLTVDGTDTTLHFVNTGVPHAVRFGDDTPGLDVRKLGAAVRYHPHFAPKGTNANFAQVKDSRSIYLRTYERGVEGETLACGTGAAATALIAHTLGLTGPEVEVTTTGNEILTISLENGAVFLTGKAIKVYTGALALDAIGL